MANSLEIGLKTLFAVLGCLMLATLIFTLSIDGLPFRKDLLTPYILHFHTCLKSLTFSFASRMNDQFYFIIQVDGGNLG